MFVVVLLYVISIKIKNIYNRGLYRGNKEWVRSVIWPDLPLC